MGAEMRVLINSDADIVRARELGRELAVQLPFTPSDLTVIVSAISELARNIYSYANEGEIRLAVVERAGRPGIRIIAQDAGPGIHDPARAIEDGYSTSGRPGLGLAGVRRLVDQFELSSHVGVGTEITLHKWTR